MGNTTNRENWAARERLRLIERLAWWEGEVNRSDLAGVFGISAAQASADLQAYQDLNPGALAYHRSRKRYEGQPGMVCVLGQPRIEDAFGLLGEAVLAPFAVAAGAPVTARVAVVGLPVRAPGPQVLRRVVMGLIQERRVEIRYWSVHGSERGRREIAPQALAHDGYRWHARAWCFRNEDYRDFVLSRIVEAAWPGEEWRAQVVDADWEAVEVITVRPWCGLDADQRAAIERDYGMVDGRLEVRTRRALRRYLAGHLRLDLPGEEALPRHLEIVERGL